MQRIAATIGAENLCPVSTNIPTVIMMSCSVENMALDTEPELKAERDVEQDDQHGDADRLERGIQQDLPTDGGADMLLAGLGEARLGVGLLERVKKGLRFALLGLDLELGRCRPRVRSRP